MEEYRESHPTLRAWGWWAVDAAMPRPARRCTERAFLLENGLLDAGERAMLAADPALLEPTLLELKYFREEPPYV